MTGNIVRRIEEHKGGLLDGFSKKYALKYLIYYEEIPEAAAAIQREKQLKKWNRAWKEKLISASNPEWNDLSSQLE